MRARDRAALDKALRVLRDPTGDGRFKVSHGFVGQPMRCVRCHLPTQQQAPNVAVPPGPRCTCR